MSGHEFEAKEGMNRIVIHVIAKGSWTGGSGSLSVESIEYE
jgi:hypothetical protein